MKTNFDNTAFIASLNAGIDELIKVRKQRNWGWGLFIAGTVAGLLYVYSTTNKQKKPISLENTNDLTQQNPGVV